MFVIVKAFGILNYPFVEIKRVILLYQSDILFGEKHVITGLQCSYMKTLFIL